VKFAGLAFSDCCLGLTVNQLSGGEKIIFYIVCFCIFIIIIISNSIISIYFIPILNCLYLNLWVSLFVHFSSASCWREGEGWESGCQLLIAGCRVKSWQYQWRRKNKKKYFKQKSIILKYYEDGHETSFCQAVVEHLEGWGDWWGEQSAVFWGPSQALRDRMGVAKLCQQPEWP